VDNELFSVASDERFKHFRMKVTENIVCLHQIDTILQNFFSGSRYDEAYKLGSKPDIEALGECLNHLKAAHTTLEQVRISCGDNLSYK